MKYLLRKEVLGSRRFIELNADECAALSAARTTLTNAFAIEEKYEIVVSNFLDLEKEILSGATDAMVRRTIDYSGFFELRSALNIRMVNLLSSTKLYLDQWGHHGHSDGLSHSLERGRYFLSWKSSAGLELPLSTRPASLSASQEKNHWPIFNLFFQINPYAFLSSWSPHC